MATREETKARTREALIDAGIALFAESGLDLPSLDAICERAGFTRGAFYVHFADREAFLIAVMERVIAAYTATIVASADPAHDLERTIDRFTETFVSVAAAASGGGTPSPLVLGATRFHLVLEACGRSEVVRRRYVEMTEAGRARLADVVRAGQRAGTVRTDIEADAAASLLVTLVIGLLCVVQTGVPLDPATARSAVLSLVAPP